MPFGAAVHAWRIRLTVEPLHPLRWRAAWRTTLAADLNDWILTFVGSMVSEPWLLRVTAGVPLVDGVRAMALRYAHTLVVLLPILAFGAWAGGAALMPRVDVRVGAWAAGALALALAALVVLALPWGRHVAWPWLRRVAALLARDALGTARLVPPRAHLGLLALALLGAVNEMLALACAFRAMGLAFPFEAWAVAALVVPVVEYVPGAPAQIGVREWLWTLALGAATGAEVAGAVLLARVTMSGWTSVAGAWAMGTIGLGWRDLGGAPALGEDERAEEPGRAR